MSSQAVKDRLAQDIALWEADGVIDGPTKAVLAARYDAAGFGLATFARYLGIAGGGIAALGLVGFFAVAVGSPAVIAVLALILACLLLWGGLTLAADPLGRYVHSSKAVIALGAVALVGAVCAGCEAVKLPHPQMILVAGLISLPTMAVIAYRTTNILLLILAVLGLFHWIGSWSTMLGRSTYAFEVQDPKVMAAVALGASILGAFHEAEWSERWPRFHHVYLAIGLTYMNLSLLILTVYPHKTALPWIVVWAAAGLLQMVAAVRAKSRLIMAFGMTAACLNLFTRFFEGWWDALSVGAFLLAGGLALAAFGVAAEAVAVRLQRRGWL